MFCLESSIPGCFAGDAVKTNTFSQAVSISTEIYKYNMNAKVHVFVFKGVPT